MLKRINSQAKNRKHENEKRCCLPSQVNKLQVMILRQKHETQTKFIYTIC